MGSVLLVDLLTNPHPPPYPWNCWKVLQLGDFPTLFLGGGGGGGLTLDVGQLGAVGIRPYYQG